MLALAVDRFGTGCPPMVCTAGWPNGAAMLLRLLGPADVRYHGDLNGEGLRIAAYFITARGVRLWRMSATDYVGAVRTAGPPVGRVTSAPWDQGLAPALKRHGVAVTEEQVADALLTDMHTARSRAAPAT